MTKIFIDNQEVDVPPGATVLDAAGKLGIDIPTLCFLKGLPPRTSCMVCLVKVEGAERFVPACAMPAADGLRVLSETDQVHQARKAAVELLLGEHLGDCDAPCRCICPSRMDIPLMTRQIAAGGLREAIATIKKDMALPATTGRICRAPCETGCRRGKKDTPVSICLLHRLAADADLAAADPYLPARKAASGKAVAIVGAGPAGLAAAYHLLQDGHACTIFDGRPLPGGMLRYAVEESRLPRPVLDAEIAVVARLGAGFRTGVTVGKDISLQDLRRDFDAVVAAVGPIHRDEDRLGLAGSSKAIEADHKTRQTSLAGVFVAGDAAGRHGMAIRAIADGKTAAAAVDQYLRGAAVEGIEHSFSVHIGHLHEGEIDRFMPGANGGPRNNPGPDGGLSSAAGRDEAARCLHCDCRKPHCKLRQAARKLHAGAGHYKVERRLFQQDRGHKTILYESGKCIACGLCIQIAQNQGEKLGLTFIGRGFDVRVAVPFGRPLAEALTAAAAQCAAACPTGALILRDEAAVGSDKAK